jgi:hypothetical protein
MDGGLNRAKYIFFYLCLVIFSVSILHFILYPKLVSAPHFLNWDAVHYQWIKENGYEGFRIAFFPLFPFLWKILGVGVYGMVAVNFVVFLVSFYYLQKSFHFSSKEVLLFLTIPSGLFYFLPYSEALFFASCTLLLVGVRKNMYFLVLVALLFCTLSRPAFSVLIPALFIMEIISEGAMKVKIFRMLGYTLVVLVGIGAVGLLQYCHTGEWFQFFSVQKQWGNQLQLPTFPLRSWGGNMITRLDGCALLAGFISGGILFLYLLGIRIGKKKVFSRELVLSLGYVGGITLSVLLFRGGSLFSLNRFVFAAPFFLVVLHFFLGQSFRFKSKQLVYLFILLLFYWFAFGSYVHLQAFLKYSLVSLYLLLFAGTMHAHPKVNHFSYVMLLALNFFFQLFLFSHFMLTEEDIGFVG